MLIVLRHMTPFAASGLKLSSSNCTDTREIKQRKSNITKLRLEIKIEDEICSNKQPEATPEVPLEAVFGLDF